MDRITRAVERSSRRLRCYRAGFETRPYLCGGAGHFPEQEPVEEELSAADLERRYTISDNLFK
jgi:hypothetical protein